MTPYEIEKFNRLECELRIAEAKIRKLEAQLAEAQS